MDDLTTRFEQAVADSKALPERPDNTTLLELYALYKQATRGDVDDSRPGLSDFLARAKWDAWHEMKGKRHEDAMEAYVGRIESLK